MAANKRKPAKKVARGRMPTKRSINLVLIEEGKISAKKAIPGILLILVLAAAFSKFLVIDRLAAMDQASARVARIRGELDAATDLLRSADDLDDTYAHYTYDDMTAQELALVDRTQVLDLILGIQPEVEPGPTEDDIAVLADTLFRKSPVTDDRALDDARQQARLALLEQLIPVPEYVINGWTVTENLLTIEITGHSLERMNQLVREIEAFPIVDSCTITTANKGDSRVAEDEVWARFIVYLQQAPEDEAPAEEVTQP